MDFDSIVSVIITCLYVFVIVSMIFVLVTDDRDPSTVLAWLFVLAFLPLVGFVAYMFLGRNYRSGPASKQGELAARARTLPALEPVESAAEPLTAGVLEQHRDEPAARIARVPLQQMDTPIVGADTIEVYYCGAEKFPRLLEDLAGAQHTISLMYLIWEQDELTAKVTEILLERHAAGVKIAILYDWLASIAYGKSELRRMRKAGILVQPCYKRLVRINYRNHMKVAVIDGEIAYTGGMNMGQEYIDGGKRYPTWRDTHLRLTGPAVAPLQSLTAVTWKLNGRTENLMTPDFLPSNPEPRPDAIPVQIVHSSVWTPFPTNRDVFITALGCADRSVWIQSPYFVPDEPLLAALSTAAASGIDVRFMMTGLPDKSVPWWVAHTYYRPLLENGARVFHYMAGFLHSKTVTVDEDLTIIGTCNWDVRSIILHDEVQTLIYDSDFTRDHRRQFLTDQEHCREITLTELDGLGALRTYRNQLFRLTSRLL